jgi:hypothetical protein
MLLDKSREALAGAARALDALRITEASGPEDFRLQFVESIGMIRRVGSIIDEETKGRRTHDFGLFWQEAGTDPLHQFVTEVRNAEFKRGERRQAARYKMTLAVQAQAVVSLGMKVIRGDGSVEERPSVSGQPVASSEPEVAPRTVSMLFRGGIYGDHEVVPLLDKYVSWLRDVIVPTAENLTT